MAIFSRRSLQRLIAENSEFLLPSQTRNHVRALNRMNKELTLGVEWEVVLLNAFSKCGKVIHERDFGGTNNADVYWESRTNSNFNFVAEITTVSDKGLDQLNPVNALSIDLNKLVASRGLHPRRFWFRVGAHNETHYKGGPKVKLKLTGQARFEEKLFNAGFHNFLEHVSRKPESPNQYLCQTDETDITIRYNPDQQFGGGNYSNYTTVYSLTDNPLYNILSKKASQLEGTNFHGPLGIIVCDGDCKFLSQPSIGNLSYTLDEVITHFLIENSSIHFILTCVVKDCGDRMSPYLGPFQLGLHLYKGVRFDEIPFDLWQIVQHLSFPASKLNALNALNLLKGPKPLEGSKRGGEITVKKTEATVKVSTRSLMELLAGRISHDKFLEDYGSFAQNAFEQALRGCQLIVSVERSQEEDDDWLIFRMSGPDPAISPFSFPRKRGSPPGTTPK